MAFGSTRVGVIQAAKNGDEIWELILTGWGNRGAEGCDNANPPPPTLACVDPYALVYPAKLSDEALPTVRGLAIAPRSDIDRVVVSYIVNPLDPRRADLQENFIHDHGQMATFDQLVSIDRPWYGQMSGQLIIRASGSEWYGDTFIPADAAGVESAFGTALNTDIQIFAQPTLRLLLYLTNPMQTATRRSPFHFAQDLSLNTLPVGPVAKTLARVIPVMGRRHISILMRGATVGVGSTVIVTIGGVKTGYSASNLATVGPSTETILVPAKTLAIGADYFATFENPQLSFLTIYEQRTGIGSEGGAVVYVDAVD